MKLFVRFFEIVSCLLFFLDVHALFIFLINQLILVAELSETVLRLIKELLGGNITELNFLSADNYGNFIICIISRRLPYYFHYN